MIANPLAFEPLSFSEAGRSNTMAQWQHHSPEGYCSVHGRLEIPTMTAASAGQAMTAVKCAGQDCHPLLNLALLCCYRIQQESLCGSMPEPRH